MTNPTPTPEEKMKLISDAITGFIPIEDEGASEFSQNHALAQAYAIKGFRDYLNRSIQTQIANLIKTDSIQDLFFIKGRILILKEFLDLCKRRFEEGAKLKVPGFDKIED